MCGMLLSIGMHTMYYLEWRFLPADDLSPVALMQHTHHAVGILLLLVLSVSVPRGTSKGVSLAKVAHQMATFSLIVMVATKHMVQVRV